MAQKYGKIIPLQGDVSSKEDLARIVSVIESTDGYVNVLIANAGISGPTMKNLKPDPTISELREYLWNMDSQQFTNTYHVNVTGVFFSIVAFLDLLDAGNKKGNVEQKSQVIATSSVGGFNRYPWTGYDYGTSKAAVVHLMKQCATAFASYQIRSNIIAPGCKDSKFFY